MHSPGPAGRVADVLVVCRANLCRSPAVEVMLRAELPPHGPVVVSSGGLRPVPGLVVPVEVASWLAVRGLDLSTHRPRAVRRIDVQDADVVVVMTRSQRSALVTAHPSALRRTVLLSEAADRVGLAADGSVVVGKGSVPSGPDLDDPYGRPADEVGKILSEAQEHVGRLAAALGRTAA